jgi:6-phosphogluconolactonase (cycloisomerase 2 family)
LPPAPTNLVYAATDRLEVSQVEIVPIAATVVGTVDHFTSVPPLPAGIVIDDATGTISGTPTAPAPLATYDIRATNAGGAAHFSLSLQVVPAPRYVYATSSVDHSISLFADDVTTGELTRAGQSTASPATSAPERLVFHPNGRFAYAPDMAAGTVVLFAIDADSGLLAQMGDVPVAAGPHDIAIDPAGEFAYVTNMGSDLLHVFSIDPITGALTQVGPAIGTSFEPSAVKVDPTGTLVFITLKGRDSDGLGSGVQAFSIDPSTGYLFAIWPSLRLLGGRPISMCIDPVRPVMYVTLEYFESALPVRYDAAGQLFPVALRHSGVLPTDIGVHVSGKYTYVANQGDDTISAFTVTSGTYNLQALATYPTGSAPKSITMDPSGRFAYVVAQGSAELITYAIDGATGALTEQRRQRTRGAPCNVAVGASDHPVQQLPRFVHVAGRQSGDVTSYTIDAATGALAQTSVMPTGTAPASIAIDPRRRFAWVANEDSSTISIHTLDATTGALGGFAAPQSVTGKPVHVAVDPSARFLFSVAHDVVAPEDGFLTSWRIDAANGTLTLINTLEVGPNPTSVVVDPTGQFVYTANHGTLTPGSSGISVFAIDAVSGAITLAAPPAAADGVVDLVFHPAGYEACAVLPDSDTLARFMVDAVDGHLTLVAPGAAAGPEPYGLAFSPSGRFAYVASRGAGGAGNLALHPVSSTFEIGAAAQSLQDGTQPTAVAVDPTGRFVYAVNAGSDTVTIGALDPVTGEMTLRVPVATGVQPGAIAVTGVAQ